MEKIIKYSNFLNEETSDTIILWADGVVDDFDKAVKKAKVKGKGGKGWDKEYRDNAKAGYGTVFFINAKNKEEAIGKIKKSKKSDTNIYVLNEGIGSFSNKENNMIGQNVIIMSHKTSNDGQRDLYNSVGRVSDMNEKGHYIIRMLDGELYTFTGEQVKVLGDKKVRELAGINESTKNDIIDQIEYLRREIYHEMVFQNKKSSLERDYSEADRMRDKIRKLEKELEDMK